ncbi:MAG: hypothetical protein MRJ92_13035 [Nitrospira sp.]|nr:hypothetical protein [Nitrospira sp.]
MIDSPRYLKHLVDAFDRLGSLSYMFLTHEDDVADAARYARRFGATRIIHRADAHAMPEAEEIIEGLDEIVYRPEFRIIPVPGHTEEGEPLPLVSGSVLIHGRSSVVGAGYSTTGNSPAVGMERRCTPRSASGSPDILLNGFWPAMGGGSACRNRTCGRPSRI